MSLPNFDYIVIGAGVAGCTLASEIARKELGRVLLLEAGGLPTSLHLKVPSQYPFAFAGKHSWQFSTVPQSKLSHRRISLPAGRTLGGSSAINAMIYMRGHRADYVKWQAILGDDWSPEQVDRAFEASELNIGRSDWKMPDLHPAIEEFLTSIQASCAPHMLLDLPKIGIGPFVRCQENGRRRSSWDLTIKDREWEPVIKVLTNTVVHRIKFSLQRATGVEVVSENGLEFISAKKGVILCAGAINSPRALMTSGVGNAERLKHIGIEPLCDLVTVGKNLHDHLVFPVIYELRHGQSLEPKPNEQARLQYLENRTGPKSSNIAEAGGFFSFQSESEKDAPDYQWHVTPTHYLEYPGRSEVANALSLGVTFLQPKSRGEIRMVPGVSSHGPSNQASNSMPPYQLEIDPGYHQVDRDLKSLVQAVQATRERVASSGIEDLLGQEIMPGVKRTSDEQVAKSIARFATTIYHYVGTCAMGKSNDDSVVDSRFRVHGLEGLWVCDASTMPTIVSANPQATVMMMAHQLVSWL